MNYALNFVNIHNVVVSEATYLRRRADAKTPQDKNCFILAFQRTLNPNMPFTVESKLNTEV